MLQPLKTTEQWRKKPYKLMTENAIENNNN